MPKILIIEDDDLVREMVATMLQTEGYETIRAQNGRQGLTEAKNHIPDLILCDVMMPGMDGYATLSAIRRDPVTATIPFVFLSGQGTKSDMRQGMELGADDYLAKPVMVDELLTAIQTRLQKQELSRKEANRKLDELRVNLSLSLPHEIRTPLSGIIGFAEVLRDDSGTLKAEEISEMASMILKSAQRLGALVENSLTYAQLQMLSSRPDKNMFVGREATVMLKLQIEATAQKKCAAASRLKDLQVSLVDAEAAISVQSMTRMVEELIDNAMKFSNAGTPIQITSSVEGNEYVLRVRDHGVGMDAKHIGDIGAYRQFGRASREQQGPGLGLTIAKMMTELYGGRFSIESEAGKGTVVSLHIPSPKPA